MPIKRKLNVKSLCEKYQALKDLESGLFNKEDAKKYTNANSTNAVK